MFKNYIYIWANNVNHSRFIVEILSYLFKDLHLCWYFLSKSKQRMEGSESGFIIKAKNGRIRIRVYKLRIRIGEKTWNRTLIRTLVHFSNLYLTIDIQMFFFVWGDFFALNVAGKGKKFLSLWSLIFLEKRTPTDCPNFMTLQGANISVTK